MIKHFKPIALFLALLMVMVCFASCVQLEDVVDDGGGGGEFEGETEAIPESVEQKDYASQFYLSIVPDSNTMDLFWVEKSEGDALSEAVYARQEKVYNYLGVEVLASSAGAYTDYIEPFRNAVEKRDGSVDCLLTHAHTGAAGLVQDMYLTDLNNLLGVDLEQDYWNTEFMDYLAIDDSRYLGFSDFMPLRTHVIAFNKDMMDQYHSSMEKSVYDMVENYEWTLDEFISLVQVVYTDKTGDGKTEDDIYGLTGRQWVPWIGFFHASNINIIEPNESGKYEISMMNSVNAEKTKDLVKKLKDFSASDCCFLQYPKGGTTFEGTIPFPSITTGRALMQLASTPDLQNFLSYDIDFGVLPYPMYDTAQKSVGYRSLQWGGYLCVPSYVENEQMVGETLEVLAFYSDDVRITFYEKVLGKQVADAPEDARMLEEYIWNNVCPEIAQCYYEKTGGNDVLYFLPKVTRSPEDGGKELVSFYSSFSSNVTKSIQKFVQEVIYNKTKFGK